MQKKHFLKKLTVDPLPILDYFVPEGDDDIIKAILGEDGLKYSLDVHTVNPAYAAHIAARMRVPYTPSYPEINPQETQHLLAQGVQHGAVKQFLQDRGFLEGLWGKYQVASWSHTKHDYQSWAKYFPFNLEALVRASFALHNLGFRAFFPVNTFMVCPSYDRNGALNNLVFRFTDDRICQLMCKWLFSHGRQATFGLEKVDPSKPVYVVEGFFDYVAMTEMGIQSVGLGSAFISEAHWGFLEGLDLRFLLDSDETGRKYSERLRGEGYRVCRLSDEFKDPWEYYQNGRVVAFSD